MNRRASSGFTLIELVMVIVVMGILALGTVRFIGNSAQGFASTVSRTQLGTETRFVVERLSRELRDALPGSLRASGACLEFIPVVGASRYVTLPVAADALNFRAMPVEPVPAGSRVAVQPNASAYALADPGAISPVVSLAPPNASNETVVSFASAHRFPGESAARRFFLVGEPVSYCVDGASLYRYQGYGYLVAEPGPGTLPGGLPGRALVAETVSSSTPFTVSGATLTRNAVVGIDLALTRDGDTVRLEHLVQVRNAP